MEKEVITLERENCVIRIHRPDIPEEERTTENGSV